MQCNANIYVFFVFKSFLTCDFLVRLRLFDKVTILLLEYYTLHAFFTHTCRSLNLSLTYLPYHFLKVLLS